MHTHTALCVCAVSIRDCKLVRDFKLIVIFQQKIPNMFFLAKLFLSNAPKVGQRGTASTTTDSKQMTPPESQQKGSSVETALQEGVRPSERGQTLSEQRGQVIHHTSKSIVNCLCISYSS